MAMARWERFKPLEVQADVMRILQAEGRFSHQILWALFSFAGGSFITLWVKPFLTD